MKAGKVASRCSAALAALGSMVWNIGGATPAGTVEAIWHTQNLQFHFRSSSVSYTCPGLKAKLAAILQSVGVQESLQMSCVGSTAARDIEVRLHATHALAATAANLDAATRYDAARRLLAHLRNEPLPSAADLPRFSARWQHIDVHRQRKLRLLPGDCELLQQVSRQLFPKLAIEVERSGLICHPGVATRIAPPLRVVALLPEKSPANAAPQAGQP